MSIRYTTSLHSITPENLQGFFVGWPNPPTPKAHLELLQASDAIALQCDPELQPFYQRLGMRPSTGMGF